MAAPPLVEGCGHHVIMLHHRPSPCHQPIQWLPRHWPTQQPVVREGEQGGGKWGGWGKENNWDQGGVQNPARSHEIHMLSRFSPSFLQHQQWDGMETTCCLVYPSCGIENEAVWSPHPALFPLLPVVLKMRQCRVHMPPEASFPLFYAASKMRRCGVHTPPYFPSFLGHQRWGGVESTCCHNPPIS